MGEEADEAMMFTTCRKLVTAIILVFGASIFATAAGAQQVIVIVNGDPITALDIEQRTKLHQVSTHKIPARQEVLDELINEKLKVKGGLIDGQLIAADKVETDLASMPGKNELRAMLLATLQAPLTQFVQQLNAPAQNLVYLLKAKEEKPA